MARSTLDIRQLWNGVTSDIIKQKSLPVSEGTRIFLEFARERHILPAVSLDFRATCQSLTLKDGE